MRTYRITLRPQSAITSIPSSDTLFGAICWSIRLLYGDKKLKEILSRFSSNDPPFILSSSFPISSSGIMFFPKPKLKKLSPSTLISIANKEQRENKKKEALFHVITKYKKFSKISYLSEGLLKAVLDGNATEETLFRGFINNIILEKHGFLIKKEEASLIGESFIKSEIRVRTRIDRLSGSTSGEGEMFHNEIKFIGSGFSLFFLLKTDEISLLEPLVNRNKFLSDHGIGGDRNIGFNHFKLSLEELNLNLGGEGKIFVTLSKYIPVVEEIDANKDFLSYDVIPYISRVDNTYDFQGKFVKDRVFYMKEGSVFKAKEKKEFYGRIAKVCVIGEEEIYQNGFAFPLFFNS
ncbi:hypothetical protein HRbin37_01609 [bacterium HR37]|nr:hypothetical protein HRbin37_01609 [bacterium HR37]